jgi:hypothetical protein
MPVTLTEMCTDDLIPMRAAYKRVGISADHVARARAEALSAETEKLVKVKGIIGEDKLPENIELAGIGLQETVLVHRTVDHLTHLEAANAISEEMGLKPSKKLDVNLSASGLLSEVLPEIEGATGGLPAQRKKG